MRFDVAMNYLTFARVQINQSIEHLIGPRNYLRARKWPWLLRDDLRQVITGDELHHQKRAAVLGEIIADPRQRRMIELRQQPGFLLELSPQMTIDRERFF